MYVEGNIGSGKSTLLDYIGRRKPDYEIQPERLAEWKAFCGINMLDEYYKDPKRYALEFQVWFCIN